MISSLFFDKTNFLITDEDVLKKIAPLKKELDRKGDNKLD